MNENTRIKTLAAATARAWDAFVIVVGMLKGGTGKTTSAWFIALYYAVVLGLPTLLLDADATKRVLSAGFDGVLHFAALALVGESVANPERYYHGNVVASLHLLDAMRAAGVKRLVFSSTCATYGEPDVVPMTEDLTTNPVNAYGASKLAVDRMIADEARAHRLAATSLRYFNVAGAHGRFGEDHDP